MRTIAIPTKKRLRSRPRSTRPIEDAAPIVRGPSVEIGGKATLREAVERDLVIDGKIIGTATYKTGEITFPAAYWHDARGIGGVTVDARMSGDRGWIILLHGVRTDDEGLPVVDKNGQEIEIVEWVLESALTPMPNEDGQIETISFVPGHSRDVKAELSAAHTRKLVRFRAFHRTNDLADIGPNRPPVVVRDKPEIDDLAVVETRELDEETWRFINRYADQPQVYEMLVALASAGEDELFDAIAEHGMDVEPTGRRGGELHREIASGRTNLGKRQRPVVGVPKREDGESLEDWRKRVLAAEAARI